MGRGEENLHLASCLCVSHCCAFNPPGTYKENMATGHFLQVSKLRLKRGKLLSVATDSQSASVTLLIPVSGSLAAVWKEKE